MQSVLAGIALALKSTHPRVKVFAAEPCGVNGVADVALCKAAGCLEPQPPTLSIAEGLLARPRDNTWPLVRDLVDDVIVVDEEQLIHAVLVRRGEWGLSGEATRNVVVGAWLCSRLSFVRSRTNA